VRIFKFMKEYHYPSIFGINKKQIPSRLSGRTKHLFKVTQNHIIGKTIQKSWGKYKKRSRLKFSLLFSLSLITKITDKMTPVPIFVLMGTAGCGKTSVAEAMQKVLGCEYIEGDSLHPQSNVDKMAAGIYI
jgi:tRNA splicing ligase